ncbi:MAG: site-2 protease family protein, partial [Clostridia bacterium]|nr:site-2 protease family protein [Clostridia bacterium]
VYIEEGREVSYYGFRFVTKELNFLENLKLSWFNSVNMVRLVIVSLGDMFRGTVKVTEISGVVGITAMMSDTAKQSMPDFWYLAALIAINLSVMNLLPFPALDGGRVIFVLYELIFRKPVNQKFESYVSMAGFVLLLALMFFVVCNDILRLIPH